MPLTRITCKGCTRPFPSITGYRSHLAQTQNALCVAVRNQLAAANGKRSSSASDTSSTSSATDTESPDSESEGDTAECQEEARAFDGDFFGGPEVYRDELFGQEEDGEDANEDDTLTDHVMGDDDIYDRSDDEDEITAELEDDAWEPVREGVPSNAPLPATDDANSVPGTDGEEVDEARAAQAEMQARKLADHIAAAAGYGVKPASTVQYSAVHRSSKVGQVLIQEETSDERYKTTVGDANPWAPFVSQTDWELARWAKLRGSKSTAFTDLLGVDSVSFFSIKCSMDVLTHLFTPSCARL